ncbi:hypothetical protein ABTY53_13810 [Streptomyces noursei]|uniref:hypothetical protein n=1 Tax=Streptomyces noursei TaxID=1971 RepID=UPI003326350A
MTRTTRHDRTTPPTDVRPQHGVAATAFAVLRRHRGALAAATAIVWPLPLRPLVRARLEGATGNFFAGYYAGILAPVIVGILVTAALPLPLSCTALAALHDRLRSSRTPPRRAGSTATATA